MYIAAVIAFAALALFVEAARDGFEVGIVFLALGPFEVVIATIAIISVAEALAVWILVRSLLLLLLRVRILKPEPRHLRH